MVTNLSNFDYPEQSEKDSNERHHSEYSGSSSESDSDDGKWKKSLDLVEERLSDDEKHAVQSSSVPFKKRKGIPLSTDLCKDYCSLENDLKLSESYKTIVAKRLVKGNRPLFVEFQNVEEYLSELQKLNFIKIESFGSAENIDKRMMRVVPDKLSSILRCLCDGVNKETLVSYLALGTRVLGTSRATGKYLILFNNPFPPPGYLNETLERAFVQCVSVQNSNNEDISCLKTSLKFHQSSLKRMSPNILTSCYRIPLSSSSRWSSELQKVPSSSGSTKVEELQEVPSSSGSTTLCLSESDEEDMKNVSRLILFKEALQKSVSLVDQLSHNVTFMRTEFNIYEEDQDDSSPRDYIVKIKNDFDSIQNALTAFKTRFHKQLLDE